MIKRTSMEVLSSSGQINDKENSYEVDSQKSFCNDEAILALYKESEKAKYLKQQYDNL
jgi:hypothetical protein